MKDIFDILKAQKSANQKLSDTLEAVADRLNDVDIFVRELDTSELEDFTAEEIDTIRQSLKFVNDTVTMILNNMDSKGN